MQLNFGSHNTRLNPANLVPFVGAALQWFGVNAGIELTGNSEEENEEVAALIAKYANKV
jgi:hypothetical protein